MTAAHSEPMPTVERWDTVTGRPLAPYSGTSDPRLGADEQLAVIAADIAASPRTLQVELGPSEVGHPCARRVGYALLRYPERDQGPAWLPYIGSAVHEQLACAFRAVNTGLRAAGGHDRYLVEHRVEVATPAGRTIAGHLDLYDAALAEVSDWKVVGATTLKAAKAGKIDAGYRRQIGLYAWGLHLQGHRVDRVRIHFLPRNEVNLTKAHAWSLDVTVDDLEQGSVDTLARYDRVADNVEQLGPAALAGLPPVDAHCGFCPWFTPGSTDPMLGCPGADGVVKAPADVATRQLAGLVPA